MLAVWLTFRALVDWLTSEVLMDRFTSGAPVEKKTFGLLANWWTTGKPAGGPVDLLTSGEPTEGRVPGVPAGLLMSEGLILTDLMKQRQTEFKGNHQGCDNGTLIGLCGLGKGTLISLCDRDEGTLIYPLWT